MTAHLPGRTLPSGTLPAGRTGDPAVLDAHRLARSGVDPGGRSRAVVLAGSAAVVVVAVLRTANDGGVPVVVL